MQDTVTCPSCRIRLRLPAEEPPGGMTCPRCLAHVPWPMLPETHVQETPGAAPPSGGAPTPPPHGGGSPTRCPSCGKATEPEWLFCPYCEEPLVGERRGRSSGVDRDVKRDGAATRALLGVLAVLGGIGTIWYFAAATTDSSGGMFVVGLLGLLLAGLVSTGIMFYRTSHNPSERGVGRVILGTFTLIGICLAAGCSLMVAVGIFLFVVCLAGGGRF